MENYILLYHKGVNYYDSVSLRNKSQTGVECSALLLQCPPRITKTLHLF